MGVYIKGMEMPTEEYGSMTITIYPNGSVMEYIGDIGRSLGYAVPVPPHEEKEENFCADCHWYEVEEQYCFRNGCHAYNESTCEHWEPVPADEPIPAPGGKTAPTTYDLLYEEGGYNSNGV